MSLFRRNDREIADHQAAAIQADTAPSRAAWRAGRGSRSIGVTRDTVVPPADRTPRPIRAVSTPR
jgi:hypothetical protein